MSFLSKYKKSKARYDQLESVSSSSIYIDNNSEIKTIYLDIIGSIKMVVIHFEGNIRSLIDYESLSLSAKYRGSSLIVRDTSKKILEGNVLVRFIGDVSKITFAKVYTWNKNSHSAKITQPYGANIDKNDNIVGTYDFKFEGTEDNRRLTKYTQNNGKKLLKKRKYATTINGLYTRGDRFTYKGRIYVGAYHYHPETNQFMTGGKHTLKSVILKKTYKRRKRGI